MQGIAYNDAGHSEPAAEPGKGSQIVATAAAAVKGENGLRCKAQFVGHCDPDATVANVYSEVTRRLGCFPWLFHIFSLKL
jgi:hypothetical protein